MTEQCSTLWLLFCLTLQGVLLLQAFVQQVEAVYYRTVKQQGAVAQWWNSHLEVKNMTCGQRGVSWNAPSVQWVVCRCEVCVFVCMRG